MDGWLFREELLQNGLLEHVGLGRTDCRHDRRAWLVVDQCHLAETLPGLEDSQCFQVSLDRLLRDRHGAAGQEEQPTALITLADDRRIRIRSWLRDQTPDRTPVGVLMYQAP